MNKLKIIKTIVFILTFLLISGTILVLKQLYNAKKDITSPTLAPANIEINLSSREYIDKIMPSDNKIYIHIKGQSEQEKLMIIHPDNQITTINFSFK